MRQGTQKVNETNTDRRANRPARAEFADVLYQAASAEGLSLEWVLDWFERQGGHA